MSEEFVSRKKNLETSSELLDGNSNVFRGWGCRLGELFIGKDEDAHYLGMRIIKNAYIFFIKTPDIYPKVLV